MRRILFCCCFILATLCGQAQPIAFYGEGYGLFSVEKNATTGAGFGGGAGVKLLRFNVGLGAEYWKSAFASKGIIPVFVQGRYFFETKLPKIKPYVGIYAGKLILKEDVDVYSTSSYAYTLKGQRLLGLDGGVKLNLLSKLGFLASVGIRQKSFTQDNPNTIYISGGKLKYRYTDFIVKIGVQF